MPAEITYVPTAEHRIKMGISTEIVKDLARRLRERELPACFVRREHGRSLKAATDACRILLEKGILPVVELYPGDTAGPLRILEETCSVGVLLLKWVDGEPEFDKAELMETLDGTGRHRLPLDLYVDPGKVAPKGRAFKSFLSELNKLALKYGHMQGVRLVATPPGDEKESGKGGDEVFKPILDACPKALASVTPDLWTKWEAIRRISRDLGGVIFPACEKEDVSSYADPVSAVKYVAKTLRISVVPRLPLTPRLYRLGWFSFEVGKVLDAWVDRKAYRPYAERPGWLEY